MASARFVHKYEIWYPIELWKIIHAQQHKIITISINNRWWKHLFILIYSCLIALKTTLFNSISILIHCLHMLILHQVEPRGFGLFPKSPCLFDNFKHSLKHRDEAAYQLASSWYHWSSGVAPALSKSSDVAYTELSFVPCTYNTAHSYIKSYICRQYMYMYSCHCAWWGVRARRRYCNCLTVILSISVWH